MTFIRINVTDYYNKPEFYRYMSVSIFDAMESAILESVLTIDKITADVPEKDFLRMIFEKQINEKPQQN